MEQGGRPAEDGPLPSAARPDRLPRTVEELPPQMFEDLTQLLWTIIRLGSDLDEERVLRRTAAGARTVTGAGRAVVELLGHDGEVEGVVTERGRSRHPVAPPGPEAPVLRQELVVGGTPVARVTVSEPAGAAFGPFDASQVEAVARTAETALRNARMHAQSERRRVVLEATSGVAHAIGSPDPVSLDEVLGLVTRSVRHALGATGAGVLVPDPGGMHEVRALEVRRGYLTRSRTLFAAARPALDEVLATGRAQVLVFGRDVIAVQPVDWRVEQRHLLGVWWTGRTAPVTPEEHEVVATFAEQAGVALDRARSVQDRERLAVVSERERIARDLHDVVIQRIFASGLQIRNLLREDDLERVRKGLKGAVGDLDLTIRDIRSTIFDLHRDRAPRLREDARALLAEYAPTLGFTPVLRSEGDLDSLDDAVLVEHLLATLRELLSNVARHAGATSCHVLLCRGDGCLEVRVADDGRGLDPGEPRSGLDNVGLRASLLGGTFEAGPASGDDVPGAGTGTVARWRVPLPGSG
ncbi:GAF domain-containing sensor histidine kinase [Nocardioides solisilvae]|uniref:GAF domain-containing sensor histidine kinase n=1 Tax=Nocardioides solisilvae TaxID=1542435 RepID=UPI000D740888|nr:histidine kinase [Nocardioides solisilvae]